MLLFCSRCLGSKFYWKSYQVMAIYDTKPAELFQADHSRLHHVSDQLIGHFPSSTGNLFILLILKQPPPPSLNFCDCHMCLILISCLLICCWLPLSLSSPLQPHVGCVSVVDFRSLLPFIPVVFVMQNIFQGKKYTRWNLMTNFPCNCFSACCSCT